MVFKVSGTQIIPGTTKFAAGNKGGTSGFKYQGSDIFGSYADVNDGASSGVDTGFRDGNNDIDNLLAGAGTLLPSIIIDTSGSAAGTIDVNGTGITLATATMTFQRDGNVVGTRTGAGLNDLATYNIDWLDDIGTTNGDDFEIRYSGLTGTVNAGNTITTAYQRMNTNRQMTISSTSGTVFTQFTIEIRKYQSSDTPVTRLCRIQATATGGGPGGIE